MCSYAVNFLKLVLAVVLGTQVILHCSEPGVTVSRSTAGVMVKLPGMAYEALKKYFVAQPKVVQAIEAGAALGITLSCLACCVAYVVIDRSIRRYYATVREKLAYDPNMRPDAYCKPCSKEFAQKISGQTA